MNVQDTTVDTLERVGLLHAATGVHWLQAWNGAACGVEAFASHMTRSFGSVAALSCSRCRRAFEKERRGR